ncbi:hypothetical protein ABZ471_34850 [Streptomyces sp. NPDC005728]|uniref:hypothetical protein n=1 Tax=Streptomyces sp. NPDC005728 TaxID=3157054 RepID=UPI0033F54B3F
MSPAALGVPAQAGQLANAAEARATVKAAHRRLTTIVPLTASDTTVPVMWSWSTEQGIGVADYSNRRWPSGRDATSRLWEAPESTGGRWSWV